LGRLYFPAVDLAKFGLRSLSKQEAIKKPNSFKLFIYYQLTKYENWQKQAQKGFKYISRRSRIAVKTASDMYNWTAAKIKKDPFVIYRRKVKPPKVYVIAKGIINSITV
jgi:phytoene synthase